jgi:hypothetical protein
MNITANPIGNYNVYSPRTMQQAASRETTVSADNVSKEEKDFFVNMYPEQKQEIADYHFYQRSGKMSGVSVGSLFDRRM